MPKPHPPTPPVAGRRGAGNGTGDGSTGGGGTGSGSTGTIDGGLVGLADQGSGRQSYSLASTGVGLRARYREKAELGLEAALAIDDPYPGYVEDWRISVAWRLTL